MKLQLTSSTAALMLSMAAYANTPIPESTETETVGPELVETVTQRPVFGQNLFEGFKQAEFKGFNPEYTLAIGDRVTLQMWGAYEVAVELTVDAQGNVFIPQVGPVKLQGVANKDLNQVIEKKVRSVYQKNVNVYSSLNAAEPVKLFVTGFVQSPGLYGGFSSDSILAFLAKSGGIRPESGSYLNVELKRNGKTRAIFNLYEFLLTGTIEQVQLGDGDTLVVNTRQGVAAFDGLVENPVQIEFANGQTALKDALDMVGVLPEATHVRIARNQMAKRNVEYLPIAKTADVQLQSGDEVTVVSDKMPGTISVSVEGEHNGQAVYILPYGSTIKDLMARLSPNDRSNIEAMQLFRESVAERQKAMLDVQLKQLEQAALSARSKSIGEANLRKADAESILQFVERARQAKPRGQVLLGQNKTRMEVLLKDQDRIVIPNKTVLVQVHGEVMFPNAMVFDNGKTIADYVSAAGGYSQKADQSRVLILHSDGTISRIEYNDGWFSSGLAKYDVRPGDEILVMPQVDEKTMQYTSDLMQVIYQVAMSTAVVLSL
ncbi:polysaccharide biosynthesis/export family protein [Endozoicomonas sp. 8E]|uniref:polysaccharide biosynthesis/export family protein n=1 Tax=Endozoicomonas sp. 8E TaxID=3035692 RepID=UPI002938DC73|nr:polysaccharide biosynthesis/export family protein [Endozoicomonas sp. 8E]WOG29994.1 polysaccharide biosynthesis/export family protein [Endozoicomonas sp. 8E]